MMKAATSKKTEGSPVVKKIVRRVVSKAGAPPVLTKSAAGPAEQSPVLKKDDSSKPTASQVKLAGPLLEEAETRIVSMTDATPANELSKTQEKPKTRKVIVRKKVIVVKKSSASAVSSASEPANTLSQVNVGEKSYSEPTKHHIVTTGMSLENAAGKEAKPKKLTSEKPQKVIKKVKGTSSMTGLKEEKKQGLEASVEKNENELSALQKEQVIGAEIAPTRPISERQKRKKLEVFVGGLDKDATEDDIKAAFQPVGGVMEVRLMMNPATGKNKGYAFVRFATAEQAVLAATDFSAMQIRGKECGVLPNQDNDTLFIGNISRDWKSSEVLQKLKEFGVNGIEELTLIGDPQNEALNRGYAFLELATHYDAVNAFQRLQRPGVTFGYDRAAKVSWAQPLIEADAATMSQVKSVFVDGLPPNWTEDMVKQNFGKFGEIERMVFARNMPFAKRKDFGFVNFTSRESALACVEAFNNTELTDGDRKVKVKVSLTRPLQKGKIDKWSTFRYSGYPGHGRGRAGRGEGWFSTRFGARGTGRGFGRSGGGGMVARSGKRLYDEDEVRMLLKAAREGEGWPSTGRGRGGRFGRAARGMTRGGYARNDETQYYDAQQAESFRQEEEVFYTHDAYSRPSPNLAPSRGKAPRPGSIRDEYEPHHPGASRGRLSQHAEHYVSPHHDVAYDPRYEQGPMYGRDEGAFVGGAQDYNEMGAGLKRQASAWDEEVYESSHRGYPKPRVDYSDHADIASHYASHTRSPTGPVTQTVSIRQGRSTREGPMPLFYEGGSGLGNAGPTFNDHSYNSVPAETSTYPLEASERRETTMYPSSLYGGHGASVGYDLHSSGYY
ncbi:hypothetical protein GOP47_0013195 [Adiantum capillus-veneris]|uniref:RRM domain-containing protein n=1 Tax=Adiantum capillus-veneris TaxID=13818 RepID=A0A9D4ZD75_ADICA|nr:hypothetical protein GOP47_0013195 [Adiantum capillus-veneris]